MKKFVSTLIISTLVGCAAPHNELMEPTPYDKSHSFAYNLASQTDLLGGRSPLRDYSKKEVEDQKNDVMKIGDNNALYVMGVAKLLTFDLTGIGALAGHASMQLSMTNNNANKARIIVQLPKEKFKSAKEAEEYVIGSVKNAAEIVYSKYGKLKDYTMNTGRFDKQLCISDICSGLGLGISEPDGKKIKDWKMIDDKGHIIPAYVYGLTYDSVSPRRGLVFAPSIIYLSSKTNGSIVQDDTLTEFSKYLPEGIYVYSPSRPTIEEFGGILHIDSSVVVPTMYVHGKKYQFIKPE